MGGVCSAACSLVEWREGGETKKAPARSCFQASGNFFRHVRPHERRCPPCWPKPRAVDPSATRTADFRGLRCEGSASRRARELGHGLQGGEGKNALGSFGVEENCNLIDIPPQGAMGGKAGKRGNDSMCQDFVRFIHAAAKEA